MSEWQPGRNEALKLKRHGYDGLYYSGECACLADDLYPCGERQDGCQPGYKGDCSDACTHEGAADGAWHIGSKEFIKSKSISAPPGDTGPTTGARTP